MDVADPFGWVGATIDGKVAVESVVGEGGFGVVYRGMHLGFRELVAVKCLKIAATMGATQQAAFLASFTEEARLLHRLSKANAGIVQALDVGAVSSPSGLWTPYIVMEWLDGETLEQYVAKRRGQGALGYEAAISLLGPAASALGVAHAQGVAHRDIKPANLFLARIGGKTTLKVLDFGIAKVLEESTSVTPSLAQTGNGVRAFSPQYAAPEQFDPRLGATGPWSDVYSFALVLLEAASGKPAYSGMNPLQLYVLATDEKRRPSLQGCGIAATSAIEAVIRRAVAVDPSKRYASIDAMWKELLDACTLGQAETMPVAGASPFLASAHVPPINVSEPMRSGPRASSPDLTLSALRDGENRLCTILFVDVAGIDALAARAQPEDLREIVDACNDVVTRCVEELGGFVSRLADDRIMAVFGVPHAHEDDAERAVSAALKMQASIERLRLPTRDRKRVRLGVRVGINTGWVFTGTAGTGTRRDLTVTGEPVSFATKLHARAAAGAVLIGRETQRHVEGRINVESADAAGVEPPSAYRVLGKPTVRLALARTDFYLLPTKLIGRAAELQRLEDAIETAVSERRTQSLTIVGPPGVGRSRLVAEVVTRIASRPELFYVMSARGAALAADTSYGLVASLFRARFEIQEEDDEPAIAAKLQRGLTWWKRYVAEQAEQAQSKLTSTSRADSTAARDVVTTTVVPPVSMAVTRPSAHLRVATPIEIDFIDAEVESLSESIALVAAMLATRTEALESTGSVGSDDDWRQAKSRKSAAIARLLAFVLERTPVVILCDDVHWADDASLDVLDELSVRLLDTRLFLTCTARSELYDRRPHWGEGKEGHAKVEVRPLARRYVEEMARDRLRLVASLPNEFVSTVVDRAAGNPLVLSETLHLLVDAGAIERGATAWTLHEDRVRQLKLPGTIQGIMQARLDRLEPQERELLGIAAVIGDTFWEGALDAIRAAPTASTLAPHAVSAPGASAAIMKKLRERQLVRARETSAIQGEREYVFAEAAMCEVAYETLSRKVRRQHHRAAAAWLAPRVSGDAAAALLARHYDAAEQPREAIALLARAAAHAAALGQNVEALRHYTRVRDLLDENTEIEDLAKSDSVTVTGGDGDRRVASWRERTRVRAEAGDVLRRLGRYDEADEAHEEARAAILVNERRGTMEGRQDADKPEPSVWEARVDFRMALTSKVRGDASRARELGQRALALATTGGAIAETPAMGALVAWGHRRAGDLDACKAAVLAGLRVSRTLAVRDARWRDSASQLLVALGAVFHMQRKLVRAERCYRQAARIIDEAENPHALNVALNNVAVVRFERGDLAGARQLFLRSLALKEREGDLFQVAIANSNLAEVELHLGQPEAALEHAKKSVRLGEQAGAHADLADCYRNYAEALFVTGAHEDALVAAERAVHLARDPGARVYFSRNVDALVRIAVSLVKRGASDVEKRAKESAVRVLALISEPPPPPPPHDTAAAAAAAASKTLTDEKHAKKAAEWSALLRAALS